MATAGMNTAKQSEKKKRIRRVRLVTAVDVKRYLGWLARRVEACVLEPEVAKTINSLMRTLLKAVEMDQLTDIEKRLEQLEKQVENKR